MPVFWPGEEKALIHCTHLHHIGQPIDHNDLLIAVHARALDFIMVTHNEREFSRVPGLIVENWLI